MIIVSAGLYYINKNPINFSINIPFKNDIIVSSKKISITYSNFKIKLLSEDILLTNKEKKSFSINNAILNIDLWLLTSNFSANFNKAEILPLIYSDYARNNKIKFDGTIKAKLLLLKPIKINLQLFSNDGELIPEDINLQSVKLDNFLLSLVYKSNQVSVKSLKLSYQNGINANLTGNFIIGENTLSSAIFKAEVNNTPIDYLKHLWPEVLFPKIQNWVVEHISEGIVTKATGEFNITKEALSKKHLPKECIKAEIKVNDTTLNYLDDYSPIKNLNGTVSFDGDTLSAYSEQSKFKDSNLNNTNLTLNFQSMNLAVKTKFSGNISQFSEFIPDQAQEKLNKYNIHLDTAKGRIIGDLNLNFKIKDNFSEENLFLDVTGDIYNLDIKNHESLKIKKIKMELLKSPNKMSLKLNENNILTLDLSHYYNHKIENNNYTELDATFKIQEKIDLTAIELKSGTIKIRAKTQQENWESDLDLKEAEANFIHIGYTKPINSEFKIHCIGKINPNNLLSDECEVIGEPNLSGHIKFNYLIKDKQLTYLNINDGKIGNNRLSVTMKIENNIHSYFIDAKILDIRNIDIDNIKLDKQKPSNKIFHIKINKLYAKNDIIMKNIVIDYKKLINTPPEINVTASSGEDRFIISRSIKNGKNAYSLYSKNFAPFAKGFNLYENINKGEAWIQVTPHVTADGIEYKANFDLNNFALTNTSIISKIILGILSPVESLKAIVSALKGGSLAANSFNGDVIYKNSLITLNNGHLVGRGYAIRINGYVDLNKEFLKFKGLYIPYMYGINKFVASIPILGNLFDGGGDSALIGANFTIRGDMKEPEMNFHPFSILTPGFLRDLF